MAPIMLVLAWLGLRGAFLACLAAALLSDLIDGCIARRLGESSRLGAKLDSWADLAIYSALVPSAYWLWPEVIRAETWWCLAALAAYLLPVLFGLLRYRRVTSYHTWGAKLSALLFGPSFFLLFAGVSAWPFRLAVVVLLLAELEETAITAILPRWYADVPSFWHALRLRREELASSGA